MASRLPRTCEFCNYSMPNSPTAVACHRYPPTITKAEGREVTSYFPLVSNEAQCGEWRPKVVQPYALKMSTSIPSKRR